MRYCFRWLGVGALLLASCGGDGGSTLAPVATITAAPATVSNASSATLIWTSTNATACAASGSWSGPLSTSGNQITAPLSAGATYLLTCTGPGGTSAPASVTVNVVPTATLTASPPTVTAGGSVTLSWSSANSTSCEASGGWSGAKSASGSQTIAGITIGSTYSITCAGAGGASIPVSAAVNVVPTANLTANPQAVSPGSAAVLNWSSTNATQCTASGGWSGGKSVSGMQSTGALSAPTTYALSCSGPGGISQTATVTIIGGSVSISPSVAALTLSQTSQFTASVPGGGATTWTVDGVTAGNPTIGTIGASGLYTAGTAAGTHTIAATSVAYPSISGTAVAAVTDLAGMYTYHNDLARDGANTQEFALTPGNVNSTSFGKLFSCGVDGAIYGQPLWVAGLTVNGARHNVVLVATEHDSLYAFDADSSPCTQLWMASLIDATHGGSSGETPVPAGSTGYLVGRGAGDLAPEVGVTGTPVIDPSSGTLYVVSKSVNASQSVFYQRLHAIDLASGNEKPAAPLVISASYPGTGDGGTSVVFDAHYENQRAALAFLNGVVYIEWAAHEDVSPWYGWILGYAYGTAGFTQVAVLNIDPDAQQGGIWMSGGAPAADATGNLYLVTGNGTFDANSATSPNSDYGDSLLQLSANLGVLQYFTPSDQGTDEGADKDFGAGGAAVLADLPAGSPVPQLLLSGGKDGTLYLLSRSSLGGFGDAAAVQKIAYDYPIYATGAFWNSNFYLSGSSGPLTDFVLTAAVPQMTLAVSSTHFYGFGGASPTVSAAGMQNGIVWTLDNANNCTIRAPGCGPSVLYAHDASNVGSELWNSGELAVNAAGNAVKFTVPTVANGRVYVGTRGNNAGGAFGSTSSGGELDVYGLLQ